jgi:hypothetical protein
MGLAFCGIHGASLLHSGFDVWASGDAIVGSWPYRMYLGFLPRQYVYAVFGWCLFAWCAALGVALRTSSCPSWLQSYGSLGIFPSIRMCLEVFAKDRFWDVFWCRFLSRGFAALLSCVGVLFNLQSFAQCRCRLLQPPLQFLVVPRSCKVVARLCSLLVALRTSSQSWQGVLCRRFLAVQQWCCTVV